MTEYEVLIEDINPCGGENHARKSFIEVETDDPIAWVRENGQHPITGTANNEDGDLVIITDNGHGYIIKYTFTP